MIATNHDDRYLTVKDLAEKFKLSVNGVRSLVRRGSLPPPLKIGRSVRWNPEVIERWERQQQDPTRN